MKTIDLSTTIAAGPEIEIEYQDHAAGAEQIKAWLDVPANLLRDGEGWAVERFTNFGTHSSTHIDAPWHYNSQIEGKRAQTIDELPLEWFFNDAVLFEMRHKQDGDPVTVEEIESELDRIQYELKPLDIILIRNGQDEFYGQRDYIHRGCGVTAEATRWLYDKGIRVMGIDAWGWDAPLRMEAKDAVERGGREIFWAAHQAGIAYSQIERLVNLAPLPTSGFKVACFPLKIKDGSGAPARVVALLDE
ncbi:MAG: cyclase family protein [Pseudomonadales bacterium]|jgi:kynurenine formamidase|nr:cyclase family protein [Pseudomonadales bacterium]MDP7597343.1 cyclase family protein [Pseudomonadales bacterium]HJN51919.1 cyclase family protein [Pseudomonadales bacterium]|tara:strand:+ start:4489 stop:5229 length:741 start_codon:yes stop_codon:yes gene_type:complete